MIFSSLSTTLGLQCSGTVHAVHRLHFHAYLEVGGTQADVCSQESSTIIMIVSSSATRRGVCLFGYVGDILTRIDRDTQANAASVRRQDVVASPLQSLQTPQPANRLIVASYYSCRRHRSPVERIRSLIHIERTGVRERRDLVRCVCSQSAQSSIGVTRVLCTREQKPPPNFKEGGRA